MDRYSYVYILTNKYNSVLYTGVTTGLIKRVYQHKNKLTPGFSSKYNLNKLVYYEVFESVIEAIAREKQIKGGSRADKIKPIKSVNPEFEDLWNKLL
jgi:putative endonuclease